jgi:hypothetical protein
MILGYRRHTLVLVLALLSAAGGCNASDPIVAPPSPPPLSAAALHVDGQGAVPDRYTAELWIRGDVGYTTTWGTRSTANGVTRGNAVNIWNVAGPAPVLVDSILVPDATTLGDIQVSDDGKLLVVATEFTPGSIVIYDLADPLKPQLISRFSNGDTTPGVHTAEVQRVNGKLYAFLSIDPGGGQAAKLVIVDLSNPASPTQVFVRTMGNPYVHDVYVREGILMTALWNDGISIFDIGGGGKGGSVANPVLLGSARTVGGKVHNIWWYHDASGNKRYAFVGEEGSGSIGSSAIGDIHVVDVSDLTAPREVAFFDIPGAGTHNFSMDEARGILFAAFYNAGVTALDVRGDLGGCDATMKSSDGRCDLGKMSRELGRGLADVGFPVYVWGVQSVGAKIYASDMLNGLWKIDTVP